MSADVRPRCRSPVSIRGGEVLGTGLALNFLDSVSALFKSLLFLDVESVLVAGLPGSISQFHALSQLLVLMKPGTGLMFDPNGSHGHVFVQDGLPHLQPLLPLGRGGCSAVHEAPVCHEKVEVESVPVDASCRAHCDGLCTLARPFS